MPSGNPNQGTLYRARLRFERDFTQLPNVWLRDRRLSFVARGILALLMSHDDGFEISMSGLERESWREGREAVRSAVRELEKYGYLERTKERRSGRFTGYAWTLSDPFEIPAAPEPELPLDGLEPVDNPAHRRRVAVDGNPSDDPTERRVAVDGNPRTIEDHLKKKSPTSPTTRARSSSPVDKSRAEWADARCPANWREPHAHELGAHGTCTHCHERPLSRQAS